MDPESKEHLFPGFQQQKARGLEERAPGIWASLENVTKYSTLKLGNEERIREPRGRKGPCTLRHWTSPRPSGFIYDLRQQLTLPPRPNSQKSYNCMIFLNSGYCSLKKVRIKFQVQMELSYLCISTSPTEEGFRVRNYQLKKESFSSTPGFMGLD